MSFFKEFKEDISAATNELLPGEEKKKHQELMNEENDKDVDTELEELGDLLQGYTNSHSDANVVDDFESILSEDEDTKVDKSQAILDVNSTATEETTIITSGMIITGNLESASAVEIKGVVNGDVQCSGKLSITGSVNGCTNSNEFFADEAKIVGDVVATGAVKIGAGSVIIGGISASSAVIAGAVKGDIDVKGPVIIDGSAVVLGNIKSRSVQINNGAVLEGFCSQSYSDVDVQSIFG